MIKSVSIIKLFSFTPGISYAKYRKIDIVLLLQRPNYKKYNDGKIISSTDIMHLFELFIFGVFLLFYLIVDVSIINRK